MPCNETMKKDFSVLHLDCTVNGKHIRRDVPSNRALLDFIRLDLGLTGTKEGCGEGECGACLVLLNGRAVNSCLMTVSHIQGKELVTIEGIRGRKGGLHPLQETFMKEGAIQCGFCTPGIIIASEALLRRKPDATLEDIKLELTGNLCRCTGYEKVLSAVETARDKMAADPDYKEAE
ncbi:MAG: (2Fe-2S)-binding protein [Elusimicrobiales bacterium]|nr:(2Fe-2S)-binding protein [Elusimicrobiales bacterium]